jgi:tetrapyrrole methylase family protein/MazG family protein
VTNDEVLYRNFDYAVEIIDRLVDDETGCPWDRVQTLMIKFK